MNNKQETNPFSIRRIRRNDLIAVREMVRQLAVFHGAKSTLTLEQLEINLFGSPPWLMGLVAEQNEDLVGYAILAPRVTLQTGERGFHLNHLFVLPEFRRMGVGQALLRATEQAAIGNGCSYITVGIAERNTRAHQLYVNAGYLPEQKYGREFRKTLAE